MGPCGDGSIPGKHGSHSPNTDNPGQIKNMCALQEGAKPKLQTYGKNLIKRQKAIRRNKCKDLHYIIEEKDYSDVSKVVLPLLYPSMLTVTYEECIV